MTLFRQFLKIFLFVLCFSNSANAISANAISNLTSPPATLPVYVESKFFLLDLISIDEKNQSFLADVFFSFRWTDPRLAFDSEEKDKPIIYLEEAAKDKLQTIWWPQFSYPNSQVTGYNNLSLYIFPDGTVTYHIEITSNFRTSLNFTFFPFDKQKLEIQVDSFLWDKDILVFIPASEKFLPKQGEANQPLMKSSSMESILDISNTVINIEGPSAYFEKQTIDYSTYITSILIQRKYGFFLYQVFLPLRIVLGISCSIFFGGIKGQFLDRIIVSLTAFLVFVATKFMINQQLPQIGYMTLIDKGFLVCYIFIAISIIETIFHELWLEKKPEKAERLDFYARWAIPSLFIISLIFIPLFS